MIDTAIAASPTPVTKALQQRRIAGILLITGPAIFLFAEFVAAAAWTNPGYSYTYDFISNLGVKGPSTLFGQFMQSPLYWVMNTGFFLFGLVVLAGVVTLRGLTGWRRGVILLTAFVLASCGVLLGLFPGSGEAMEDGTGDYHAMGAFAGFIGANILAITLGSMRRRLHLTPGIGKALVTVGIIGLASTMGYLASIVLAPGDSSIGIIGLIERGATHPFLVGLLCAGASILRHRSAAPTAPPA